MAPRFRYPQTGALMRHYREGDFLDSQVAPVADPTLNAADLTLLTFFAMPRWVTLLLGLRNLIMGPFGVKTGEGQGLAIPTREEIVSARYKGVFGVESATNEEVILGTNDRHLDFRVSILKTREPSDHVALSTWVHPHSVWGWLYLWAIYPFHKLIVWRALANLRDLPMAGRTANVASDRL